MRIIEPVFEKRFVNEFSACRAGRGTRASMRHVLRCTQSAKRRWGKYYVLKCDVTGFFPSIKHDILKGIIRRSVSGRRILRLIDTIISSHEPESQSGRGIPTGALTSWLFANVYLDPLSHYLKETCRVKYCARYMDGFVIICRDKAFLRERLKQTGAFLRERLDMGLNPKTAIYPGRHGIDFCGYRTWPARVKPRKRTIKRAKRRHRRRPQGLNNKKAGGTRQQQLPDSRLYAFRSAP